MGYYNHRVLFVLGNNYTDGFEVNMGIVSRICEICNAYESAVGHGLLRDGKTDPPYSDPELNEAWEIGYKAGVEIADENDAE